MRSQGAGEQVSRAGNGRRGALRHVVPHRVAAAVVAGWPVGSPGGRGSGGGIEIRGKRSGRASLFVH
jgi:hypothetical protein